MKKIIENITLDEERALYGQENIKIVNVNFDGPADGESAVKECKDVEAEGCYCNLRYPFWHVRGLKIANTVMTENCRAALWYSENIRISDCKLLGIKALRECSDVKMSGCKVFSPEFGWSVKSVEIEGGEIESVYFLMRSSDIKLKGVKFSGKYSFQYVDGGTLENCTLSTKDAFWHSKNVTLINCKVGGEYLGWYSENLTLINCEITGTQPLCYCKGLKIIDCSMEGCDLAFEKSEAEVSLTSPIVSIKNFYKGKISVPAVEKVICDDPKAKGKVFNIDKINII